MNTLYHNIIGMQIGSYSKQETLLLMTVIPKSQLGDVPDVFAMLGNMPPGSIYSGIYPKIVLDPATIVERPDLIGLSAAGIITSPVWAFKELPAQDFMGTTLPTEKYTKC